jgi:hypothetical protein
MTFVYPGDPSSGSSQTQNNNFNDSPINFMCHANNFLLNSTDPAYQYVTQKIIQNTVRVPSSLYTSDLGALSAYQRPASIIRVNWNQMSDRAERHKQTNSGRSQGSFYHGSSTRATQTRERPGAGTPGGSGVDIKHNSYYRYINRLKAKKDIRRGYIPPTYGEFIPFSRALPIYGGKTIKTSIVAGCNCPFISQNEAFVYRKHFEQLSFASNNIFSVGAYVYARTSVGKPVLKAQILSIVGDIYTVQFQDLSIVEVGANQLIPYFACACNGVNSINYGYNGADIVNNNKIIETCSILNNLTGPNYLNTISKFIEPIL